MKFVLLILAFLLSGCSTLETFDNRVSCSMDKQEAYVNSMCGPIGVTSKISPKDAKEICARPVSML